MPAYNYKELKNSTIVKILLQKKMQKDYSHCEKCVFNNYSCTHILLVFRVIRSFKENFNRNIKIPKRTCCSENMVYMIKELYIKYILNSGLTQKQRREK